jgi:alpha-tubulin suppressor-like RCC1 family protein
MDKADANTSVNRNARKTSFVTRYNNESGTTEDLSFPYPIKKVASHDHTTLFLTNNGDVYGLGINKLAQIDEDSTTISQVEISNATDIAVMLKVLILREDNVLLGCGRNANHALGFEHTYNVENLTVIPSTVYNNEKILFVGAGRAFSLVITARSNVYLMGQK